MCKKLGETPPPGYAPVRAPGVGWVVLCMADAVTDDGGVAFLPCLSRRDRKGLVHLATFRGPVAAIRAAWQDYTRRLEAELLRRQTPSEHTAVAESQPAPQLAIR